MPVRIQSARPTSILLPHCLLKHLGDVILTSCLSNNNSLYLITCTYAPPIPLPHCLLLKHLGDVMLTSCLSNNNSLYLSTCTYAPLACMQCDI
jgi:hypothetical protein